MTPSKERLDYFKKLIGQFKSVNKVDAPNFDEAFHSLLQLNADEQELELFNYQDLMVALLGVLANPKISQLMEEYFQQRVGKMLLNLEYFFLYLGNTREMDVFIDEAKTQYANSITAEGLEYMIKRYEEKLSDAKDQRA
jgi:hypothetical protein